MTHKRTQRLWSLVALACLLAGALPAHVPPALAATEQQATAAAEARALQPPMSNLRPFLSNLQPPAAGCYATDLDCDGDVDEADVSAVAEHWNCATGDPCYHIAYDLDANGVVDAFDLAWVGNDYDISPPVITLTAPAEGHVAGSSQVEVGGTVADRHAVTSVTVNGIPAALTGDAFSATVSLPAGNQVLDLVAEDVLGQVGLASRLVAVDGSGPEIEIRAPRPRQAVYTLTPEVDIGYSDFYGEVAPASLVVEIVDAGGGSTDVTGDLLVTAEGAGGTLGTPLAEDASYTLTVSLEDSYGNPGAASAAFYVPPDPASITPPEEPEVPGWVSGVIYDSSTCNEHLTTCSGLAGALVTLEKVDVAALAAVRSARQAAIKDRLAEVQQGVAASFEPLSPSAVTTVTVPITGTVVTGPDGFFAFPVDETAHYWLRVEKEGYTYGQREADIVREHSTAANAIYLTAIDPAATACDSGGCSHSSSDGVLQVEIPAGAIPAGDVVATTATNFSHVEFLPSGSLPPGTWETYAFNVGGDSEYAFEEPITVRQANSLGFAPGTQIPLGYWNPHTQQWEHEGFGVVDATGQWVEMSLTHFSNYDCNDPISLSEANAEAADESDKKDEDRGPANDEKESCPPGSKACLIRYDSGTLAEEHTLPAVSIMGEGFAPAVQYDSDRAETGVVIDIGLSLNPDPGVELLNYLGFELYIEGVRTDAFTFAAELVSGEVGRYRYLWDGRDAQGNPLPPGVYGYAVKLSVPYIGQYCYTPYFGGPPDCENMATGTYVTATDDAWVSGTVALDGARDSALGAGWVLDGQQRLYEDEAGQILVTDGRLADEFHFAYKDHLTPQAHGNSWVAWTERSGRLQYMPEDTARTWHSHEPIAVGDNPWSIALSPDGAFAYVANYNDCTVSVVDLVTGQQTTTCAVGCYPTDIAVSPDGSTAYVPSSMNDSLSVVDLAAGQQTATIAVGDSPWHIAVSPDGAFAYLPIGRKVMVVDLVAQEVVATIYLSENALEIALSPDGLTAYLVGPTSLFLCVVDLVAQQETATIAVGSIPQQIAVSPDGATAYVTHRGDENALSVVDLDAQQKVATIAVVGKPRGIALSPDGGIAYVTNEDDETVAVVDLVAQQRIASISVGESPRGIVLSPDGSMAYIANSDDDTVSVVDPLAERTAIVQIGALAEDVTFSPDGALAYTANPNENTMSIVDLASEQEIATIAVGYSPQGIALSPDGQYAYVTNLGDSTVSVVDLYVGQETATITVGKAPSGIALSADGAYAYVTARSPRAVYVVDVFAQQQTATISLGAAGPEGIALSRDGAFAYVTTTQDTVGVIDLKGQQQVATIAVGSTPRRIALSPDGAFAYVTNYVDNTISVVDLAQRQQVATIAVQSGPHDIAVSPDGATAYVTASPGLCVVDLAARQTLATVPVALGGVAVAVSGARVPIIFSRTPTDHSTLTYDAASATYTRRYPDGTQVHFNADGSHDYTLDRKGTKTSYSYNPDGTVAAVMITAPGEAMPRWTWAFGYQDGKLAGIADPAGRTTAFSVDGNGQLGAITGPDGAARQYAYDAAGRLTEFTDEDGAVTRYEYDANGRVSRVLEPPRAIYDADTGHVEISQEVRTFTPSDTGYALINASPIGDPENPSPPVPKSAGLEDRVEYERGGIRGHTNRWGYWLDKTDGLGQTTYHQYDGANNRTRTDYPDGTCALYTYDDRGKRLSETHLQPADCAATKDLTGLGDLSGLAQSWSFTYEERFNRIKTETDPLGHVTTYIYDYEENVGEAGNLIRIEYPPVADENGQTVTPMVTYSYNAHGQVIAETDKMGVVTARRYTRGTPDEAYGQSCGLFAPGVTPVPGLLTQVVRDEGGLNETTTYKDFDAAGNPQTVLGPGSGVAGCCGGSLRAEGTVTRYTYDASNRVLSKEDALGIVTRYEYDGRGNRVRQVQDYTADGVTGRNVVTEYTYDASGLLIHERTAADGLLVETGSVYDGNGMLAARRDGLGHETVYRYDDGDQLVSVTDPAGNETAYTYTLSGQTETVTDPEGSVTRYVYDAFGRLVTEIVDDGGLNLSTHYSYDLNGNALSTTDPAGVVTCYEYDSHDRSTAEVRDCGGLGLRTAYGYNLNGNLVAYTDRRGVVTYYEYDRLGRGTLSRRDDGGLNLEMRSVYDAAGNLAQTIDERGIVTAHTYDDLNRLVKTCEDALGLNLCTTYTYDRLGRQERVTDPKGVTVRTETNAFGLRVRVTEDEGGLNAVTVYRYDHALNLIAIVNDNGYETRYAYTPRNQVATEAYPDGTAVQYTYDGRGNVLVRTAQDGTTASYLYDGAGRQTGVTFSGGGSQAFGYDAAGRLASAGQTMNGHTSALGYTYNALGDVTATTQALDGLSWPVSYAYDHAAGKVTTTYPSGVQRVQELDALGRPDAVKQGDGSLVADYAYHDLEGYITVSYANGLVDRIDYDALGRTTRVSSPVADYRYGYDAAGNRSYVQRWHQAGQPADVYQYDGLHQLTQVWYGADATEPGAITAYDQLQGYDLDGLGNRLEVQDSQVPEVYLPNDGYRLTDPMNRYQQVGASPFSYDLRGNTLGDGVNSYGYDALNRQVSMSGPGGTAEYVYDAQGRRIARVVGGVTIYYVYDIQYRVLEERGAGNSLAGRYTYGLGMDEPLTMERGGTTYYYHRDAVGSVTEMTDAGGALAERYEYDAYGAPRTFDGAGNPLSASAIGNPYLFVGRDYDPESGNYYLRARVYRPRVGRFLQVDPYGYRDRLNLYLYARNSPLSRVDALGLFSLPIKSFKTTVKGHICVPTGIGPVWFCLFLELEARRFSCCDKDGVLHKGISNPGSVGLGLEVSFGVPGRLTGEVATQLGNIGDCPEKGLRGDLILRGGIGFSFQLGVVRVGGGCSVYWNLISGATWRDCRVGVGSFFTGFRLQGRIQYVEYLDGPIAGKTVWVR